MKGSEKCFATRSAKLVFSVFFEGSSKLWPFTVTIPLVFSVTTIIFGHTVSAEVTPIVASGGASSGSELNAAYAAQPPRNSARAKSGM